MNKISPLRSGIEAFNKFKTQKTPKAQVSNPFAASFKEKALQLDVFNNSTKEAGDNGFVRFCSSMIQNVQNGYGSIKKNTKTFAKNTKDNAISFGANFKQQAMDSTKRVQEFFNKNIELNFFKYNVSNLKTQPVSELRAMLVNELKGI